MSVQKGMQACTNLEDKGRGEAIGIQLPSCCDSGVMQVQGTVCIDLDGGDMT